MTIRPTKKKKEEKKSNQKKAIQIQEIISIETSLTFFSFVWSLARLFSFDWYCIDEGLSVGLAVSNTLCILLAYIFSFSADIFVWMLDVTYFVVFVFFFSFLVSSIVIIICKIIENNETNPNSISVFWKLPKVTDRRLETASVKPWNLDSRKQILCE